MAARTPREALAEFIEPLKEVVACIATEGFVARGALPGGRHVASFQNGAAFLRRSGRLEPIHLSLVHTYRVVPSSDDQRAWVIRSTGWIYEISETAKNPIIGFHWHPTGTGRVTWPHLHAYGSHGFVDLHKLHLPTGHVSVEAIVRFLIEDLDVIPRLVNWRRIVDRRSKTSQ